MSKVYFRPDWQARSPPFVIRTISWRNYLAVFFSRSSLDVHEETLETMHKKILETFIAVLENLPKKERLTLDFFFRFR